MSYPVMISGEASETDSEDDTHYKAENMLTKSVQGLIITGEDSESENENGSSIPIVKSAVTQNSVNESEESNTYDSLFHQKLRECNIRIFDNIERICENTVTEATKNLNSIDQKLLSSQITIQNAVTSLKTLSVNSLMIKSKLHSLLSSNFLANITIDKL